MKTFFLILIFLLSASAAVSGQNPPLNRRIHPGPITQSEPVLAVSPADPQLLFAAAVTINTTGGFQSEGVYLSTDGGSNWFGSDTCSGRLEINHGGDPGVAIDPQGRLILTHAGFVFAGMFSHYSDNLGASWSDAYTITASQPEDKGGVAMDENPGSPYFGRMYAAWVNFVSPFPVSFSYTANSGESWTPPQVVNNSPPGRCSGGTLACGNDGRVYLTWAVVESAAPFVEDYAGFAVSGDGGGTWSVSQNIFEMNGISGTLPEKGNLRVNGLPQISVDNSGGARNGWLYIVSTEKDLAPAGNDPDIILHRSTDGGMSWSAGIRVNQDGLSNGNIQYFPAMDIDAGGGINIIYYDDRHAGSDSAEVMLARSTDGGNTWQERVISDHRFAPKPIVGGSSNYQGDHIALKAVNDKLYALWMDDSAGLYQIWLAIVDNPLSAIEPGDGQAAPSGFALLPNYPNPFNPETQIRYRLPQTAQVHLTIFNALGQTVRILVEGREPPGDKRVGWDGRDASGQGVSSGVYFCRLEVENPDPKLNFGTGFSQTRKMLLLR